MGARASSGHSVLQAPIAPIGRYHKASSGRLFQAAPTGHLQKASNRRFNIKAPTGRFLEPSTGCFPDGSNRPSKFCPVRGQPGDVSQAAKFWTTNGLPEGCFNYLLTHHLAHH
ncbi:hypothetical protein PCANC_12495 [Puccinia coronata f. sp. avenae]|uniref:Uncharacterized protein n=1 Tax=Puccinia coronata f. sp. avenae TaxID=200324 RepID=A0A2N5UL21_9BASI|nr:hypothetical protein PCANC_12495 [Puccinia coronata f. sp. avenae]